MQPKILHEDDSILVLEKPAGWIVNKAQTTKTQPVVQKWLEEYDYPLARDPLYRSGIVHRLDKETSGILLVAKTRQAFANLQAQFKERRVKKTYTTLVHGLVDPGVGEIEVPVGRLPWRRDRFGVLPGGRGAKTKYKLINLFEREGGKYSLLQAFPETGRTHQIRIHLKYLGHPIVGDEFYAGRKTAKADRLWCPRLFLHASGIKFTHPQSGEEKSFESPLAQDLASVLKSLASS
ncbi:MAG: Pseudouridine synthase [Candidatus Woesebacteria bacterium GW2011_GWA1_45_8]|uniref:Pseudouridine synthase n=1 Tax=Candidatus Woesebacteria bacterium GW2011_GWA1_45_8 TaxID=1618559 RepID=A0A0G1QU31_9BACT|nr:MAG: Pseudouridine synthase [Candidatus Woesebacteria bacterium GW2011_GWA1_45_8]